MKKTCKVKEILEYSNRQLAREDIGDAEKSGICMVLEQVLMSSGNYNGFQHRHWFKSGISEFEDACRAGLADRNKVIPEKFLLGPKMEQYDRVYYSNSKLEA